MKVFLGYPRNQLSPEISGSQGKSFKQWSDMIKYSSLKDHLRAEWNTDRMAMKVEAELRGDCTSTHGKGRCLSQDSGSGNGKDGTDVYY